MARRRRPPTARQEGAPTAAPAPTLLDSISAIAKEHAGAVVVSGSHGGISSARFALAHPPALVVFNDAGIGKDRAGVAGLELLASFHVAALTVAADSARIGDADDTLEHGRISCVNGPAGRLGFEAGRPLKEALGRLPSALTDP